MLTLLAFIIVLSILVIVHEFGHFLAAKIVGVRVDEFGLGYPPKIFSKKIGNTEYSLNALPFGGFVRLYGEDGEEHGTRDTVHGTTGTKSQVPSTKLTNAFYTRSKLERSFMLLAGVAMNFLLGVIVITYLFTQGVVVPTDKVIIQEVIKNTPAETAGLKVGDQVVSLNEVKVKTPKELIEQTKLNTGKSIALNINRCETKKAVNCSNFVINLIPRTNYPANEGAMGIAISNLDVKVYSITEAPIYGTIEAFKLTWYIAKGILDVVWQLITAAKVPEGVAGPIGIYQITGQAIQLGGLMGVLQLLGLLSLNLAVVNLLPIPAIDGGRFFLILVETVIGRKKTVKLEQISQTVGVFLIISLIVLMTATDLSRISAVQNFFKSLKLPF